MKNVFLKGCVVVLAGVLMVSCGKEKNRATPIKPDTTDNGGGGGGETESKYLTQAKETNAYIRSTLLTPFGNYKISNETTLNTAYEWYNASQIYADAAMVAVGEESYRASMDKTITWMSNMWDKNDPNGGYFAAANLDGSGAGGDKYVDDNGLTGMIYLEAYDITTGEKKEQYLNSARKCAHWLMNCGLWDDTYGGGFWWSTGKQNKPTQSNALVMQLFLRLYKITGETYYRDWAVSINNWLNSKMYDSNTGLYIWMIDGGGAGTKHTELFTYDNAIMLEAYLIWKDAMNDNSYLAKAQAIGNAMNKTLWDKGYNLYIFHTKDVRITPAWCGWGSQAMIKLYEADGNTAWLSYAKGNIDAINNVLRSTTSKGYYQFAGLNGAGRYTNMEGVDQAWMQRLQAMLSKYK